MAFVVAPEPSDWLAPLVRSVQGAGRAVTVWAPWALPGSAPAWLPARALRAWRRRQVEGTILGANPVWWAADAALRVWGGTHVDRVLDGRVLRREACDRLAARSLPGDADVVYAPSLGARHLFARAKSRGTHTILVEDLPSLRALHEDLDRAARRWPDTRFLRRFRAPARWVAEQECERALADGLRVRTGYALRMRAAEGHEDVALLPVDTPRASPRAGRPGPARVVLLAGVASARNGSYDVLDAIEGRDDVTLLVQPGEGTEPRELLARRGVRVAREAERSRLEGVDLVVAPAWCEAATRVLDVADGVVPVLASNRAGRRGEGPAPGEMVDAIRAALG